MQSDPEVQHGMTSTAVRPQVAARATHFLVDLDGTLVQQGRAVEGAAALLGAIDGRYALISNNSSDTAVSLARRLRRIGLAVPVDRIVLAGEQTLLMLAQHEPRARIRLLAGRTLARRACSLGLRLVDAEPDIVVLARDEGFSYRRLMTAANELRAGARLIATNPDLHHPAPAGRVVPETGSLLRALVACSGVTPELVVGKPEPRLLLEGLRRLGAEPARTLVIGDNPATDAAGAQRLGMRCVLVGAGGHAGAPSLRELLELPQYRFSDNTSKVLRSDFTERS